MEVWKMDLQKMIIMERAFSGYSPKSVLGTIQLTQEKHQQELTSLKDKLQIEKEINQKLTEEVELTISVPQIQPDQKMNPMLEDLNEHLIMNNKSILELQIVLERQESIYMQELELKKKQKYLAKKRMQEALQYLKILPEMQTDLMKKKRV